MLNKKWSADPGVRGVRCSSLLSAARFGLLVLLLLPLFAAAAAGSGFTERVSVATDGSESNDRSSDSAISSDGRYVAFNSDADNLVSGDTNGESDVFVHDRETGTTVRVSVAADGTEGNDQSSVGAISSDGRYVAIASDAGNLVPDDSNGQRDIFVHDRDTGSIELVSVASDGTQANNFSTAPVISGDGRYVTFYSSADNLVSGDTNGANDIFVHDRDTGQTNRVSVASDGAEADGSSIYPTINGDGRFVAFSSNANNLVPDDTNGAFFDVFVHDLDTGQTIRASVAYDGTETDGSSRSPSISSDGNSIAFASDAGNLVPNDTNGRNDIFVYDLGSGVNERVSLASDGSEGNHHALSASISPDGRHVAFESSADNHVPGDTNGARDIFIHDRNIGITERLSLDSDGAEVHGDSYAPAVSLGGRYVAFYSGASTLVTGDANETDDIFVRYRSELVNSPSPLDFGPVLTGQTLSPLSVTITNARLAQITVSGVSAPNSPFTTDGGTCGAPPFTLLQGESCEFAYGFSPTSTGAFESSVTLTSDAPDSPHTLNLQGVGVDEALTITPEVLDFGGVLPGDSTGPASVTMANAHDTAIEISDLTTVTAPFANAGGTCGTTPFTLAPFASCTLEYTFGPTYAESFDHFIEAASDAPSSANGFTLQGEGLARSLSVSPELVAFGNVPLGEVGGAMKVTLTSTGLLDVTLGDISAPGALFELTENTCGDVLPAGASCYLSYNFTPTSTVSSQAQVTIESDAESNPHTITLFGDGSVHGTELISRASGVNGAKGDSDALSGAISGDGRYVAFVSYTQLAPADVNGNPDVYLRDLSTNETFLMNRVSGVDGEGGNFGSLSPSISADGRFVAFTSSATNLHPDDAGEDPDRDVYVRDRLTHETILVSRAAGLDGAKGNDDSGLPSLSADGRFVAFGSLADNLHPDDSVPGKPKVFVRDLQTDELTLVSRAPSAEGEAANDGSVLPSISSDGRFVAFVSGATNLHPDDMDGVGDVFVRDLQIQENILVSRRSGPDGVKGNSSSNRPSIAADGHRVVFESTAPNLSDEPANDFDPDIFVRDLTTDETILVSRASGANGERCEIGSRNPSISKGGRWVAFQSLCPNLHPDDINPNNLHDVFVRDLLTHQNLLASRASGADGEVSGRNSQVPSISHDGRYVAFMSVATNLHPDDSDSTPDIYVRDLLGPVEEPQLTFDPPSLDFGEVTVGESSSPLTATLANVAHGDADIAFLLQEGLPASGFELAGGDCQFSLPAGTSCEVGVSFTPSALGAAAATLEANAILEGVTETLNVSGVGVAPSPQIDVDPGELASILLQGQAETQSLTITNSGVAPLDWEVAIGSVPTGSILRTTGPVTAVTTDPAPNAAEGSAELTGAAEINGEETEGPHSFPEPLAGDITLTHSVSPEIQSGNSIACNSNGSTVQNSFMRTFTLADFGITSGLDVSSVTFGIESLSTTASISVNLYILEGDFILDNLTLIGTASQELGPQGQSLVTVPVSGTAPAGSTLVVEVYVPDITGMGGLFLPGSNNLGETAPSYIAAAECGSSEPTPIGDIGFPNMHLVMSVMGAPFVPDCAMPGWLGLAPTSDSVAAGESQLIDITFDTAGLEPGDFSSNLCLASNDPEQPLTVVPVSLAVEEGETKPGELAVSPIEIDFGEVTVGSLATAELNVLNAAGAGSDVLELTSIELLSGAPEFEIVGGDCQPGATVLAPGEICTVEASYQPTVEQFETGAIRVQSGDGQAVSVVLSGAGVQPGNAIFSDSFEP